MNISPNIFADWWRKTESSALCHGPVRTIAEKAFEHGLEQAEERIQELEDRCSALQNELDQSPPLTDC